MDRSITHLSIYTYSYQFNKTCSGIMKCEWIVEGRINYTCIHMSMCVCAQSVCGWAFSLLAISPASNSTFSKGRLVFLFDSKIACLSQSIKINNKHVYRQSQVRKPIVSKVKWAECSLIIGTGCWVLIFAWSSISRRFASGRSVCWRVGSTDSWVRILGVFHYTWRTLQMSFVASYFRGWN